MVVRDECLGLVEGRDCFPWPQLCLKMNVHKSWLGSSLLRAERAHDCLHLLHLKADLLTRGDTKYS